MSVKNDLSKITGIDQNKGDVQTFLFAVLEEINDLTDAKFEKLPVNIQNWFTEACEASNNGEDIPDPDEDGFAPDEAQDITDDFDLDGDDEMELTPIEDVEVVVPKKVAKTKKPKDAKKKDVVEVVTETEPTVATKKPRRSIGNVERDKFGCLVGSKAAKAVELFVAGAKMSDVKKATGLNHYNLLNKLTEQGHKKLIDKGIIQLIHKDDV